MNNYFGTEILNAVYSGTSLNTFAYSTEVLNAVFDDVNDAIRINILNIGQIINNYTSGITSEICGGIYHIYSNENLHIKIGRILYSNENPITDGILTIGGILQMQK